MEQVVVIYGDDTKKINEILEGNWKVKMIVPFCQSVSKGEGFGSATGKYGAYVVLEMY